MIQLNQVYACDALSLMKELEDESVDFIITSPPYGKLRKYKGFVFDFESIARESYRVLKQDSVMVWVVADETIKGSETLNSFKQALFFKEQVGFKIHDTMIYEKNSSSPNIHHRRYMHTFEYMFVLLKGNKPKAFNPIMRPTKNAGKKRGGRSKTQRNGEKKHYGSATHYAAECIMGNVWKMNTGVASGDDRISFKHPAPFPQLLAERHILTWTNPEEIVLDYLAGSGTSLAMAKKHNRQFIGCDISEEYIANARERISRVVPAGVSPDAKPASSSLF